MSYQPIENYGVIGDLHTVALVGMDGSIDFMCFPEFDSPTIFAALLDDEKGGRFRIAPVFERVRQRQIYLTDTNILLTRFLSEDGVAEISDFMPVEETSYEHNLVRRVKVIKGDVRFRVVCRPRFDYARVKHDVEVYEGGKELIFTPKDGPGHDFRLKSSVPLRTQDGDVVSEFELKAGQHAFFILEEITEEDERRPLNDEYVSESFKGTVNFWRRWIERSQYKGRWREMVNRSALILKLLTSQHHGSIVAAPTFGLPEILGGGRNWDYRYTWVRDASFTLYALMRLGYTEEAHHFMRWIEARCKQLNPDGSLQVLYGIDGREELPERTLEHLEGYRGSSPVRIGNDAYQQMQLDIYGELMDSVYLYDKYGDPISYDLWTNLLPLMDWVCKNWNREGRGIWEIRGSRHAFLYSRVMCWVALDRAIRLANKRGFPAPTDRWRRIRDVIYHEVFDEFWDPERQTFVQYRGAKGVDASHLLLPLVKFVSPRDPRWLSTLRVVEDELVDDSLVYRYLDSETDWDGLQGREGTFCMCSFWYVEALGRSGDIEQARFLFEKMLGYANHLGLYAEELGPHGEHMGNYPQAFTHIALISAAFDLDRKLSRR